MSLWEGGLDTNHHNTNIQSWSTSDALNDIPDWGNANIPFLLLVGNKANGRWVPGEDLFPWYRERMRSDVTAKTSVSSFLKKYQLDHSPIYTAHSIL